MTKREELDLFLLRADEFIEGKYILADVKIINLLKAIAGSDTLLAIFKNCLDGFDYETAKNKYLLESKVLSENRGEFVLPQNTRELLALIFNLLVKMDNKEIDFSLFMTRYFFEDGSLSSSYQAFVASIIKPFRNAVKGVMESVIEGKLQDPIEALTEEENRKAREKEERELTEKREKELLAKAYGLSIKNIREILLQDKTKVKNSKLDETLKAEITLVIDMLANVIESEDKDAIEYAFVAYKYLVKSKPFTFIGRNKKMSAYIKEVLNGL